MEDGHKKLAKIHFKKVLDQGERRYEITSFENFMTHDELPREYDAQGEAYMYIGKGPRADRLLVSGPAFDDTSSYEREYRVGKTITVEQFNALTAAVRVCGERLTMINDRIRKDREEWDGKEVIVVI